MFSSTPLDILKSDLIKQFRGAGEVLIERVETFTFDKTGFLRKHMGQVLRDLELQGLVKVGSFKKDGKKRVRNTYPNDALVTFL